MCGHNFLLCCHSQYCVLLLSLMAGLYSCPGGPLHEGTERVSGGIEQPLQ